MEISDNPGENEIEPEFKYIANMHGDETPGREFLLYLIEWLCEGYNTNDRATDLINNTSFVFEKDQRNIEKLDNFNKNQMYEEQHDDVINHKFDKISSFSEASSLMKLIDKIKENKI